MPAPSRRRRLSRATPPAPAAPAEPPATPPTPQTRARLRRDAVAALVACGRLAPRHAEAAAEIRAVAEAVGRGMFPTSRLGIAPDAPPERRKAGRDFLERMSAGERRMWQRRYLPWTKALTRAKAAGLPGTRRLQLVLDVAVDNDRLRDVERRYRLRHGAALRYLRDGLELYGRGR